MAFDLDTDIDLIAKYLALSITDCVVGNDFSLGWQAGSFVAERSLIGLSITWAESYIRGNGIGAWEQVSWAGKQAYSAV